MSIKKETTKNTMRLLLDAIADSVGSDSLSIDNENREVIIDVACDIYCDLGLSGIEDMLKALQVAVDVSTKVLQFVSVLEVPQEKDDSHEYKALQVVYDQVNKGVLPDSDKEVYRLLADKIHEIL